MTDEPETLRQWVGTQMRATREQHGRRQDDVARAARTLGLAWSRSKVAALERGEKALPAEELLLLPLVLAQAQCGQPSLADLLPDGPGAVRLGERTALPATALARTVRGEDVDVSEIDSPRLHERLARNEAWIESGGLDSALATVKAAKAVSGRTPRELVDAERTAGDAERIAARRLGVPFSAIVAAALATWGHGLTEERDTRAANHPGADATARSVQAARGHVTRELYRELAPAIERYHQAVTEGEES